MSIDVKSFSCKYCKTVVTTFLLFALASLSSSREAAAFRPFSISGPVEIRNAEDATWIPLQGGTEIHERSRIRTGASGALSLRGDDGSELYLGPDTQIEIRKAFFEQTTQQSESRIGLLHGSLEASLNVLKASGFTLTNDSLAWLAAEHVPQLTVNALNPLIEHVFPEEHAFLSAVEQSIGGEQTLRYKLLLLESAANSESVFSVETELSETTLGSIDEDAVLAMTVDDEQSRVDVQVLQGQFQIRRIGYKGLLNISGLSDRRQDEGLRFVLDTVGGRVRLTNRQCRVAVESSVWPADFHALIGESDTLVRVANGEDAPDFLITSGEGSMIQLKQGQKVLLYVPAAQDAAIEFPDIADASFDFCQELSSLIVVEKGCPTINGQENCCGEVNASQSLMPPVKDEQTSPPPSVNAPNPPGGSAPLPTKPPVKPGSPILP